MVRLRGVEVVGDEDYDNVGIALNMALSAY